MRPVRCSDQRSCRVRFSSVPRQLEISPNPVASPFSNTSPVISESRVSTLISGRADREQRSFGGKLNSASLFFPHLCIESIKDRLSARLIIGPRLALGPVTIQKSTIRRGDLAEQRRAEVSSRERIDRNGVHRRLQRRPERATVSQVSIIHRRLFREDGERFIAAFDYSPSTLTRACMKLDLEVRSRPIRRRRRQLFPPRPSPFSPSAKHPNFRRRQYASDSRRPIEIFIIRKSALPLGPDLESPGRTPGGTRTRRSRHFPPF